MGILGKELESSRAVASRAGKAMNSNVMLHRVVDE